MIWLDKNNFRTRFKKGTENRFKKNELWGN